MRINFVGPQGLKNFFPRILTMIMIAGLVTPAFAVVFTNPASITINDATAVGIGIPYPSEIPVSGLTGTVTNVTVSINNINSTFPDDVDMLLVAPGGNNLIIMSDVGGSADTFNTSFTLDDAAAAVLSDTGPLVSGSFKPTNIATGDTFPAPAPVPSANATFAAAFNGISPNGTWSLFAVDDLGVDMTFVGNGWSLTITTTGSPATTFTNSNPFTTGDGGRGAATPYASTIVASGLTGAITDVNITLTNVNHLNPDDIDILLVGPSGKRILLLSDAGGTADVVSQNLTFDDAAAAGVPDAGPMVTGTFRPTNFGTGDTMPSFPIPYPNSATAGSATLSSVFNGTEGNGTWSLYIVDDATVSNGSIAGGWSIDITAGGTYGAKRFTSSDFGGDGQTDVGIYRPSDSNWWIRNSRTYQNSVTKWGSDGDIPVPSDYDGDLKTDFAVFRPSTGTWIVLNSASSTVSFIQWGASGDTVVPADYDGDGKIDVAIWRTGVFWVRHSSNGSTRVVNWGVGGDVPVRGHFEGTDGADFAVFRPSNGTWYVLSNNGSTTRQQLFGLSSDELVPADYDADGKTDIAVWRPSDGNWYIFNSGTAAVSIVHVGSSGDTPVPGDYDGDSKADTAVWRSAEAGWYIYNSGTPFGAAALRQDSWGLPGDVALPSTYFP